MVRFARFTIIPLANLYGQTDSGNGPVLGSVTPKRTVIFTDDSGEVGVTIGGVTNGKEAVIKAGTEFGVQPNAKISLPNY